ncbi:MAG: ABC transporter permease [Dehalococcoidales bacterium]
MSAFTNHFAFEFRSGTRDKTLLMMNYLFPLGLYLLLGFMVTGIDPTFSEKIIPAMIIIAIMSSTILSMPSPQVKAREDGIFRSYRVNGVPAISILSMPALTTIIHMVIVAAIITATAPLLFKAPLPANWAAFILFFLLTAFIFAGMGMLISVISNSIQSVVLWSQVIFIPSMMLGGLTFPDSFLPEVLARIGKLLPAIYSMKIYQGLAMNYETTFNPLWSIIILLTGGVLSYVLANYLFCWDTQNSTRRGHRALAVIALVPLILGSTLL